METTVIIVNYNGKKYLKGCFDSLLAQKYQNFDIIFLDNGSNDESLNFMKEHYPDAIRSKKIRLLGSKTNLGFAEGNNVAYNKVTATYVALLNNDTVISTTWLQEVIEPLKHHQDIGIVGTAYLENNDVAGRNRIVKDHKSGMSISMEHIPLKQNTLHEPHLLETFYVSGNGMALRKSEYNTLFDKDYFAYGEDIYICWLTHLRNKHVVVNTRAEMEHFGGSTKKAGSQHFNKFLIMHGTKNQLMNHLIFYEWKNIIRITPHLIITQIGIAADNPRKIPAKFQALWWIISNYSSILQKRHVVQQQRNIKDKKLLPHLSCKIYSEEVAKQQYNKFYYGFLVIINVLFFIYCWMLRVPAREIVR